MAPDRCIDGTAAHEIAGDKRNVFALHAARRELAHEIGLRFECLRHDQQAGRVLVEPVNDARARNRRELRRVMEERVLQRSGAVAGAGMHDEPGRLVDHHERGVLVDDRERNRFGGDRRA
jgi:hypothetical protein